MRMNILRYFQKPFMPNFQPYFDQLERENSTLKLLVGKMLAIQVKSFGVYENIQDAEFKAFSQFGDDGILQYLTHQIRHLPETFIEFGVGSYQEANTRFLLMNDNWRGLIMDGSQRVMDVVEQGELYWRYNLTAVCTFIDRENVNRLFAESGYSGEIGLLSIDIDGNDYWVWENIDIVDPVIVIAEYNSVFGPDHAISVPYDPEFVRTKAHYSNLYWGCSLKALCLLAERKGYAFVGSNSNGNNAYFVRKDRLGKIPSLSCVGGYVESKFRESRDHQGNLTYISESRRLHAIKDMKIYHIERKQLVRLGDLFGM